MSLDPFPRFLIKKQSVLPVTLKYREKKLTESGISATGTPPSSKAVVITGWNVEFEMVVVVAFGLWSR